MSYEADELAGFLSGVATSAVTAIVVHARESLANLLADEHRPRIRLDDAVVASQAFEDTLPAVQEFCESQSCRGLLVSLTYTYLWADPESLVERPAARTPPEVESGTAGSKRKDRERAAVRAAQNEALDQLRHAFADELSASVGASDGALETLAGLLWDFLQSHVVSAVRVLRSPGGITTEDLLSVTAVLAPRRPITSTGLQVPAVIAARAKVSLDDYRAAREAVKTIRSAAADHYEQMRLPHSREVHRYALEDLYVQRELRVESSTSLGRLVDQGNARLDYAERQRLVILGNPGAGKSTFIRHTLYKLSTGEAGAQADMAPLLLELKDVAPQRGGSLLEAITDRLRREDQIDYARETLESICELGMALIVFDGLDEIVDLTTRRAVVDRIEAFSRRYPLVSVLITSRRVGYEDAGLSPRDFRQVGLRDFDNSQVEEYVERWFQLTARDDEPMRTALAFLDESRHAEELRSNPLMLSLLCTIYKYRGYIPENRPEVYEECAELLFWRWDKVRRVPQAIVTDAKARHLIQDLAIFFFSNQEAQAGIGEKQLVQLVSQYLADERVAEPADARQQARDFLDFCSGRAWLLSVVGSTQKQERLFGFTHRTFMEYFAARWMARNAPDPAALAARLKPLILRQASEVVPQIALQWYDEKQPNGTDQGLRCLLYGSPNITERIDRRLVPFAVRCLQFMSPRPMTTELIVKHVLSREWQEARMLLFSNEDCVRVISKLLDEEKRRIAHGAEEQPELLLQILRLANLAEAQELDEVRLGRWRGLYARALAAAEPQMAAVAAANATAAATWLLAGRVSPGDYVAWHGARALVAFETADTLESGPLTRILAERLAGTCEASPLGTDLCARSRAALLSGKRDERLRPSLWTVACSWLEHGADSAAAAPTLSQDEYVVTMLVCLGALESPAELPNALRALRELLHAWCGVDVLELAALGRASRPATRDHCVQEVIKALVKRGVEGGALSTVEMWMRKRASLCE